MQKDVYFFMTRSDMRQVLAALDQLEPVQYAPARRYPSPDAIATFTLDELPDLGISQSGSEMQEESVLVMPFGAKVGWMEIRHTDGGVSYLVGPSQNPESLSLWAAGEHGDSFIIRGRFGMSDDTPLALKLYKEFRKLMKERCSFAKNHFLGQDAVQRFRRGTRLALSSKANPTQDFKLPE